MNTSYLRIAALACTLSLGLGAAACSSSTDSEEPTTQPQTTAAATSAETEAASEGASESKTSKEEKDKQAVKDVAETFKTLAPAEFFERFESCKPTGLEGSTECTGPEVGQFQFYDDRDKADSTIDLLTGLRSSEVISDENDRIVGWSKLGSTAILTVVDRKAGQVMQQPTSSDKIDPLHKLLDLGLISDAQASAAASTLPQATTTEAPSSEDPAPKEKKN